MTINISENLDLINDKINKTVEQWQHGKPILVAVSKYHSTEKITSAIKAGQKYFGENKIQESEEKWPKIKEKYPDIKLHFIGHLQSNKAKNAVKLFDVIETIDSKKLAKEIKKECEKQQKDIRCFIQVNTGDEAQKHGVSINKLEELLQYCREEINLEITGLMCIPPVSENATMHFAFLKKLARNNNISYLSMGMSADYEKAIAVGTNEVRIGTAIFGSRET